MSMKSRKMTFFTILDKFTPQYDPCDTTLGSLKFWKIVKTFEKALDFCAQPMKWDETSFNPIQGGLWSGHIKGV